MREITLRFRPLPLLVVAALVALVAGISHVRAAGAPTTVPLAIEGTLTDASGRPATGLWNFTVAIFDVPTGGTARATCTLPGSRVDDGRFILPLGNTSACVTVFRDVNNTWVEMEATNGTQTVRTARATVHAVPYALEADHASRSSGVVHDSPLDARLRDQSGAAMAITMCAIDERIPPDGGAALATTPTGVVDAVNIPVGSTGVEACRRISSGYPCLSVHGVYPRGVTPGTWYETNRFDCNLRISPSTAPMSMWACCVR